MPFVTPRTWVAGDVLTAAQLNVDIRDNVGFLANVPACRVTHGTTQSLPDATETVIAFNGETYDTNTMHDNATNNSRITFNTAGIYIVTFNAVLPALTTYSLVYSNIRLGGATSISYAGVTPTTFNTGPNIFNTTTYKFSVGQYVEALIYQDNTAGSAQTLAATFLSFAATWQGLG